MLMRLSMMETEPEVLVSVSTSVRPIIWSVLDGREKITIVVGSSTILLLIKGAAILVEKSSASF